MWCATALHTHASDIHACWALDLWLLRKSSRRVAYHYLQIMSSPRRQTFPCMQHNDNLSCSLLFLAFIDFSHRWKVLKLNIKSILALECATHPLFRSFSVCKLNNSVHCIMLMHACLHFESLTKRFWNWIYYPTANPM